jgi:hypothetical protein
MLQHFAKIQQRVSDRIDSALSAAPK